MRMGLAQVDDAMLVLALMRIPIAQVYDVTLSKNASSPRARSTLDRSSFAAHEQEDSDVDEDG